jgi:hypothetical protein
VPHPFRVFPRKGWESKEIPACAISFGKRFINLCATAGAPTAAVSASLMAYARFLIQIL